MRVASCALSHYEELLSVPDTLFVTATIPAATVIMLGIIGDDELAGGELDHMMSESHWTRSACIGYGLAAVVIIAFVVIHTVITVVNV